MELKDFLILLLHRNKEISYDPFFPRYDGSWIKVPKSFAKLAAESTKDIDFGCDFDKDGICFNYRNRIKSGQFTLQNQTGSPKCCCDGCARAVGYLQHFSFHDVEVYASLFDENDGFWRAGTGCILPRELRSTTCVRHHCLKYDENDKIIQFPKRYELILFMVGHLGDAFHDYREWYEVCGSRLSFHRNDLRSFLKFIDEWDKRSQDRWPTPELRITWRDYYAKNPYISGSKAV